MGRVVVDPVSQAGREILGELRCHGAHRISGGQRVGAGTLEHRNGDCRLLVEIGIAREILGGQLDSPHVAHPDIGGTNLLDDEVGKLIRIGQASQRAHRDLEGQLVRDRRLVEHAGGDLHVLPLQRLGDVEAVRLSDCSLAGSSQTRMA